MGIRIFGGLATVRLPKRKLFLKTLTGASHKPGCKTACPLYTSDAADELRRVERRSGATCLEKQHQQSTNLLAKVVGPTCMRRTPTQHKTVTDPSGTRWIPSNP